MNRFTLAMLLTGIILGCVLGCLTRGRTGNTVAFALPVIVSLGAVLLPRYAGVPTSTAAGIFALGFFGLFGVIVGKGARAAIGRKPRTKGG